jgi:hypothetical protein
MVWTTGVRIPAEVRFFQTGSEAQWVPGAIFRVLKRPVREVNHSPLSSAEVKNDGAIPPLPPYVIMA